MGIAEIIGQGDLGAVSRVYHVVNLNLATSYSQLWRYLSDAGLKCDVVVDRQEWLKRLAEGPVDPQINPTYKLLVSSFLYRLFATRCAAVLVR
jgi:hypothetical protein